MPWSKAPANLQVYLIRRKQDSCHHWKEKNITQLLAKQVQPDFWHWGRAYVVGRITPSAKDVSVLIFGTSEGDLNVIKLKNLKMERLYWTIGGGPVSSQGPCNGKRETGAWKGCMTMEGRIQGDLKMLWCLL